MTSNFGGIPPLTAESEKSTYKLVSTLAPSFLIGSSSFLQVTRTTIKARMTLNLNHIGLLTAGLARQVAQRETTAHLRAIINEWGNSAASTPQSSPIWLKFKLIPDIMGLIITCELKGHPINSNQDKDVTLSLDAQGQLTPYSVARSGQNQKSIKHLYMFL